MSSAKPEMGLGRKISLPHAFLTEFVILSGMDIRRFSPRDLSLRNPDTTFRWLRSQLHIVSIRSRF
jgi:hypothetical protein